MSKGRKKRESTETTRIFSERLSDLVDAEKSKGKKLAEIANEIGISSGALSEWCADTKTPTIDMAVRVAKYFGKPTDWLLGLSEHSTLKEDVKAAAIYTGLSDQSIEALHYLSAHGDNLSLAFLDRELSLLYRDVVEPQINIPTSTIVDGVDAAKTLFGIMELYASGSIPSVMLHYGYLAESVAKYGISDERAYKEIIIGEIRDILDRHREAREEAQNGEHQKD